VSYEGYVQTICENGHYGEHNDYDDLETCSVCGAPFAMYNCVDDTNCEQSGVIPQEVLDSFLVSPAVKETCNLGHVHVTAPARYRAPSKEEIPFLRHYIPYYSDELVPMIERDKELN
jgi:hypothetical protein